MQWLRDNVLSKLRSWGKRFALGVQWVREKGAQGVDWMADPVLFVGFLFFAWLAYNTYSGMEALPKDEAARTLEWLKFYAYVVGGIVLIWQVRIANRRATALERTAALGEKGNITERFKNAIEHLGGESESIRMGGIYGLYHVVRESRGYADTVLKILCAHAKSVMAEPGYTEKEKPSNEIAAILDVLFPVIPDDENHKIEVLFEKVDISGWHLQGADVSFRNMQHVNGIGVNLLSANLSRANLILANLSMANLSRTGLQYAELMAASLSQADLSEANLAGADLSEATLSRTCLSNANLVMANLSEAYLLGANLSEANLSEANLSEANLLGVHITAEQLLQVKTLYEAQLNDHIREEILRRKPELWQDYPSEEGE